MHSLKRLITLFFAVSVLFLVGCSTTTPYMSEAHKYQTASKGSATITFYRYSTVGKAVQASVAEVTEGKKLKPVGVIMDRYKVTQEVEPGSHTYVVMGEGTSVITCTVKADKHYYVKVKPYMGNWKARFFFDPITHDDLTKKGKIRDELFSCTAMELNSSGTSWFKSEEDSIREKLANPAKSAILNSEDGIDELL